MSPIPLGVFAASGSARNAPTSIEYLLVNGGQSGFSTGGNGGFYSTGSLSVSLGTSQTVTVGAAGGNTSLTSVSAPTNYNGTSRSQGGTAAQYVNFTPDGCVQYNRTFYGYGGGSGGSANGSSGYVNVYYSAVAWGGGNGGSGLTTFLVSHSGGGGGLAQPSGAGWYNYCWGYQGSSFGQNGFASNSTYGRGGTNGTGTAGVVVIRYPDTFDDLTSSTGTKATSGGYKYYTFTSTGSFTV